MADKTNTGDAIQEVPLNYYCNFTIELKEKITYGVEIFRFNRYETEEFVDITLRIDKDGTL